MFKKRVQFFESYSKRGFISLSHIEEEVQCFESYSIILSQIEENQSLVPWVVLKKSILWIILKKINPLSHIFQKIQFLKVIFFKKAQVSESYWKKRFNSLSHLKKGSIYWDIQKEGSILRVILIRRNQFFEAYWKKVQSLSHIEKRFNS